jgi:hypothetical protein
MNVLRLFLVGMSRENTDRKKMPVWFLLTARKKRRI